MRVWMSGLLCAVSALGAVHCHAMVLGTPTCGTLTDPVGDTRWGDTPWPGPDLTGLTIAVDSAGVARISVCYSPGTFAGDSHTFVGLDVDRNPATGWPGTDGSHTDAALIGADYFLQIYGSQFQGNAQLNDYAGTSFRLYPVIYGANGCDVYIPLTDLGNNDGLLNFAGTSDVQLDFYSTTGIRDYIPDNGMPVGRTDPVPEPAATGVMLIGGCALLRRRGLRR